MLKTNADKVVIGIIGAIAVGALVAACSSPQGTTVDTADTNTQLKLYQQNGQSIPLHAWSQQRQTVIDVENAQADGMATTTFFFNLGIRNPIQSCPSIGFPVPSTAQLTNPSQEVGSQGAVVGQMEPNGVYTGQSSGTYVICVAPNGTRYVDYWEGDVQTVGGPAHWDNVNGSVVLDGAPSVPLGSKPKNLKSSPTN